MKLHPHEVKAIVDTLEKEHEKRFGKKDFKGLTKEEKAKLVQKNKKIRKEINALSLETRRELAEDGNGIWFDWQKNKKGLLRSEKDTLEIITEDYLDNKRLKIKIDPARIFDREEMKRKVIMASIESQDVKEIMDKVMPKPKVKKTIKRLPKKKK